MADTLHFRGYDMPVSLVLKTGSGTHNYEAIANWHISQLQKYIGVKATDNVVEIGCGVGRVAIPLTEILTDGTYLGTEVIRTHFEWCRDNIGARNPNFQFIYHDIHDTLHNPKGTLHAKDIRLPVESGTVDIILLHSVFTHMLRDEIVHYMREFRRILKPTGRVYASCFLVNDDALKAVRDAPREGWKVQFKHRYGEGCYINSPQEPRAAVAFEDRVFVEMASQANLEIEQTLWGNWSGTRENPRSGQDVVILKPSAQRKPEVESLAPGTASTDFLDEIEQVNECHKTLVTKINALARKAKGDRRIVYKTTMSDGGEVKLSKDVEDLFRDARLFQDRWKLTEYCAGVLNSNGPPVDCIVEVGVETGVYSAFMADLFDPNKFVLIDLKYTAFVSSNERSCMTRLTGYSTDTIPTLADRSISFAYVDGAHDFKTVSDDIEKILPKIKVGGIIQFNDYATFNLRFAQPYGVKAAVNKLINSRRVAVVGHGLCPLGFDDVAVRVL